MRLNQSLRMGAIALLVWSSGVACQPASDTATGPDETTASPNASPDVETVQKPAAEPSSPDAAPGTAEEAGATPAVATANESCSVSAFVTDTDPAGLNVRSGPGSDFAVVDTLPTKEPVEVSIVGVSDGWFLINEAQSQSQAELTELGWVYAPLLGVTTTSLDINNPDAPAKLYEAPDGFSNVKAEVPKSTEVTLLSCSGDWLQVQSNDATGWLAIGDQCSNPTAPCP